MSTRLMMPIPLRPIPFALFLLRVGHDPQVCNGRFDCRSHGKDADLASLAT